MKPRRVIIVGRYLSEADGRYRARAAHAAYYEELATHFDEVVLFTRVTPASAADAVARQTPVPDNVTVVPARSLSREGGRVARVLAFAKEQAWLSRAARERGTLFFCSAPDSYVAASYGLQPRFPSVCYFGADWAPKADFVGKPGLARKIRGTFYGRAQQLIFRRADGLIVVDRDLHDRFASQTRKPMLVTRPIMLLSAKHLSARPEPREPGPPRLLFVGSLIPVKGLRHLAEAFLKLRAHREAELIIVGNGPEQPELRRLLRPVEASVRFVDFISDFEELRHWYLRADLFVLSSLHEGFPRVLYEAMAHSLPIVSTDVGSIVRVLTHERDALLVPAGSAEALHDGVERLLANLDIGEGLAEQGLKTVRAYLEPTAASQHAQFIEEVWERRVG
jgi:glycosyltransferase involved in cell wall biosynthesis